MARKVKPSNIVPEGPVQVNAHIDPVLAQHLRIKLAIDGITYREWLEARIREYAPRLRLPPELRKGK